ncbi:serine/threonine-protein kinase, partial [Singulisphaera rosea]
MTPETDHPHLPALDSSGSSRVLESELREPRDPDSPEPLWETQERHWHAGMRIPAEAYLRRHPEISWEDETAFELVFGEYWLRSALGEAPEVAEFTWRFPRFADRFRRQVAVHRALWSVPPPVQTECAGVAADAESEVLEVGGSLPLGFSMPGYRILSILGRGGMGTVYKGWQINLKRLVAIKILNLSARIDPRTAGRFQVEAEAAARFHHPNIIHIYERGEVEGMACLVMEYASGGNLHDRIAGRPQDPLESARIVETLACALGYAHQCGIVHRDLKPANVLLTEENVPKLADFGLAKLLEHSVEQTKSGDLLGTPGYMAPEQAQGKPEQVTAATDIYALGIILYEMLTGQTPFQGVTPLAMIGQILTQEPVPPRRLQPKIPRDLETICLKCLEKAPRQRYASAIDLAHDLGRFLDGESIMARPIPAWGRAWKWVKRRPTLVISLASLGLAFVLLLIGMQDDEQRLRIAAVKAIESQHVICTHNAAIVFMHEHNYVEARKNLEVAEGYALRTVALDEEDRESHLRLIHVQYNLAGLNRDERRFQDAARLFRQVLERLGRLEREGKLDGQAAIELRYLNTLKRDIAYCDAAAVILDMPARARAEVPDVAVRLLLLRVNLLADRGRRSEIPAVAEELCEFNPEVVEEPIWLAKALSTCISQIEGDGAASLRRQCGDRAV